MQKASFVKKKVCWMPYGCFQAGVQGQRRGRGVVCVRECVRVCECAPVCVCVCVSVCVCVWGAVVCVCVRCLHGTCEYLCVGGCIWVYVLCVVCVCVCVCVYKYVC